MTVGIGGAGSKLSALLDPANVIVNVSETELNKVRAANKILAVLHSERGPRKGCRKNPELGRASFASIRDRLAELIRGDLVLASTGGGTGNGICTELLQELTTGPAIVEEDRTRFGFLVPYADGEPAEYVKNTIDFVAGPVSKAIDSGNTGNIFLFSNHRKFEERLAEPVFNELLVASLKNFLEIPQRGAALHLLDGHIDYEDFELYLSKPYFNSFTAFEFDPAQPFAEALKANPNPFLLPADTPIEALFFLEVPQGGSPTALYDILDHLAQFSVVPTYSVAENPERQRPFITISTLYSRKPDQLVMDLQRVAHTHDQQKIRKGLEQQVTLKPDTVDLELQARLEAKKTGKSEEDILSVLRRLGKLR